MKFKWMKESYWLTFVRMIWWINVDCFISYQRFLTLLRTEVLHLKLWAIVTLQNLLTGSVLQSTYSQMVYNNGTNEVEIYSPYTGIKRKMKGGNQSWFFFQVLHTIKSVVSVKFDKLYHSFDNCKEIMKLLKLKF